MAATLSLTAIAGAFAMPAAAASFAIDPVQIKLVAGRESTTLTITNTDKIPISIRVIAFAWSQPDGIDVYTPTTNVIASPPVFTVPAGKTQILRVGLRNKGLASAYRVILEEIPLETPLDGQIRVNLRLDLPLYLLPKGGGKAELSWTASRVPGGDLIIQARNNGTAHDQVLELMGDAGRGQQVLSSQRGVVLAASARTWKISNRPDLIAGMPFTLKVRSQAGESEARVVVQQR